MSNKCIFKKNELDSTRSYTIPNCEVGSYEYCMNTMIAHFLDHCEPGYQLTHDEYLKCMDLGLKYYAILALTDTEEPNSLICALWTIHEENQRFGLKITE